MIFTTGGSAFGDISTRSNPASLESLKASFELIIPSCSPLWPITRTSRARISSLIRIFLLIFPSFRAAIFQQFTRILFYQIFLNKSSYLLKIIFLPILESLADMTWFYIFRRIKVGDSS